MKLSYSYTANNRFSDSDVTRNDAHDAANSEYSDGSESKHSAMAGVTLNIGKLNLRPSFNLDFMHENINYRRGKLDTIAARNATMPKPRFELTWRPSRSQTIRANVAYSQTLPSIVSTLDYTDDTNPLFITQGNSRLKRSGLLKTDFNYSLIIPKFEQVFTFGIEYRKGYDPVGLRHGRLPHSQREYAQRQIDILLRTILHCALRCAYHQPTHYFQQQQPIWRNYRYRR